MLSDSDDDDRFVTVAWTDAFYVWDKAIWKAFFVTYLRVARIISENKQHCKVLTRSKRVEYTPSKFDMKRRSSKGH